MSQPPLRDTAASQSERASLLRERAAPKASRDAKDASRRRSRDAKNAPRRVNNRRRRRNSRNENRKTRFGEPLPRVRDEVRAIAGSALKSRRYEGGAFERHTAKSGCATRPGFLTTACSSARSCSAGRGALRLLCAGGILGKYRAVAARGAVVSHIPTKFSGSTAGLDALRYSPGENCRLVGCGRGALSEGLGIYHRQIARGQHPRRMLTKAPRATPASAPPRRAGTAGQPRH